MIYQGGPRTEGDSYQRGNPYAPPVQSMDAGASDGSATTAELVDASTGQRFATMLLDFACYVALASMVGVALQLLELGSILEAIPDQLFGFLILSIYYVGFEGLLGRTPGKFITGTRVVHEKGGKASLPQIVGRTMVRFVPFEAFTFLSSEGARWHDRWSKTRVVRTRGG